jgi:glycosyltransferase involved in cell wall biosynthesis
VDSRLVRLAPEHGDPVGRALFSYVIDPFLAGAERKISYSHTQDWESWAMATTLAGLGFAVDVVQWTNRAFVPRARYDLVTDVRLNLERWAPVVGPEALLLAHLETAHWSVNNDAQRARLAELAARRGIHLHRLRLVEENRVIESAEAATILGNEFTQESYRFAGKPLYRVPISNPFLYPTPADKDFAAVRRRFVYFGGIGFVHKGLDLVLEAFAGAPELELLVMAPVEREPDFELAFDRELRRTPNIRLLGWQDVAAPEFLAAARSAVATVFPSCAEGGGGSVVTAMHAGLIPVVTRSASVDVTPETGVTLADARVETIRAAARELAARPPAELAATAESAWRFVRARHTRESFRREYRAAMRAILERFRPALARRVAA